MTNPHMGDGLPARADIESGQGMGLREQQLVRMDGTVLIMFYVGPGQRIHWLPPPEASIQGPCAGRVRVLPDGPWMVVAYFPDGYPGPLGSWPQDQELEAAGPFSIDTGVFMK
jgi:hypothetical protein